MKHTEETKRKIKEGLKKKFPNGREFTKEWKEKQSKRMKGNKHALGHKLSEKHKKSIIDAHKGDKSHWYKDGRCQNIKYISWQKNEWHHRKRNANGHHTFGEWENLKAQYNWTCLYCWKKEPEIKLTEDHIIPLSKGGSNWIENIQPLCLKCNMRKHNKIVFMD